MAIAQRRAIINSDTAMIPIGRDAKYGYALVDKQYAYLDKYRWNLTGGHVSTDIKGKKVLMHRLILEPADDLQVDHINQNKLDNRTSNLRPSTLQQNLYNRFKRSHSKQPYKGIEYISKTNKYRAKISVNKVRYHIGMFNTALEAARAYDKKAIELHGEFASLNNV